MSCFIKYSFLLFVIFFIIIFTFLSHNFQGDDCKNSHDVDIKKREACKFYIQGFCLRGDTCLFMHGIYLDFNLRNFSQTNSSQPTFIQTSFRKTHFLAFICEVDLSGLISFTIKYFPSKLWDLLKLIHAKYSGSE